VGIAAQMYGKDVEETRFDPVATSRMARPFPIAAEQTAIRPWSQSQRTFNAQHDVVRHAVQEYAESRSAERGPYGWKKYIASQEWFLRFCCHTVCRDLLEQSGRMPVAAASDGTVRGESGS